MSLAPVIEIVLAEICRDLLRKYKKEYILSGCTVSFCA